MISNRQVATGKNEVIFHLLSLLLLYLKPPNFPVAKHFLPITIPDLLLIEPDDTLSPTLLQVPKCASQSAVWKMYTSGVFKRKL